MTTDYYALALEAIPEIANTEALIDAMRARRAELTEPGTTSHERLDLAKRVLETVRQGAELPADLGRQALDTEDSVRIWSAQSVVLEHAQQIAEDERKTSLTAGANDALRALRQPFDQIVSRARAVLPTLQGVGTAGEAIAAGPDVAAAWSSFGQIAGNYAAIRDAQRRLFIDSTGHGGGGGGLGSWLELPYGEPGVPRNVSVDAVLLVVGEVRTQSPSWRQALRDSAADTSSALAFDFGDQAREHLARVLTTPDLELWLPTVPESIDAYVSAVSAALGWEADQYRLSGRHPHRPAMDESALERLMGVYQLGLARELARNGM